MRMQRTIVVATLARTVLPFLDGKSGAKSWAEHLSGGR